ncbi:helix-turn-helix transcriptional regulator [Agromyces marinus]|uniref:Helix-turn-helix transcriptional regulator n=1 Tax=Agromyces marinus TaxID=1389020 RepID=A0ABM8H0H6_9MICO|nr:helix-turn-helix transcriptional regulator [Agromyces marinus]UIP57591.1 HTH-type transcriptional regulator MalT [Agromyces marinus]BDZ54260.1 helix-turn-helix transcriptional regulator [Agromyces marinus]
MTAPSALEAGRIAARERRWADAVEQLARADAAGGLAASDLELLATAAILRGDRASAVDAGERAYAAYLVDSDDRSAARWAAWLALELVEVGEFSASLSWSSRAMRVAETVGDPLVSATVRIGPSVARLASGDAAEARRTGEEILRVAERHGDRELIASASLMLGKALIALGAVEDALRVYDRAMAVVVGEDTGPFQTGDITCAAIADALMASDLRRASAWMDFLDRWCRAQPSLISFGGQRHALRAQVQLVRGDWAEAAASVEAAMAGLRAGDFRAAHGAPYSAGELQRLRGAFHAAAESYRRAAESGWDPQPGRALLLLAGGRTDQAQAEIRRALAGGDPFTRRYVLPAAVEIEVAAGDLDAARRALEELRASGDAMRTPLFDAVVAFADARVRSATGDGAAALARSREAADGFAEAGAPYDAARARVLAASVLAEAGDRDAAETEFRAAREVLLALGAEPALAEATRLLGERRRGALTEREVEVLRLVSTGLTNRGIAERLTLSEKTVARHLSNIFGKLGVASRAAATAYAYEHGLV